MSDAAPIRSDLPYTRIYGGRLEEFVQRRDTLARELRSSGERDAANAVKALRKPSRIAWALDQGAIEMPGSLAALADAAADLVTAQSSGGDARAAMANLRGAIRAFTERAAEASRNAGYRIEPGALVSAVHAVLGRQDSFEQVRAGCLVEVPEAGGLDVLSVLPMPAVSPATSSPPAAKPGTSRPTADEREQAVRADFNAATAALRASRKEMGAAQATLANAETRLKAAEERLRAAQAEAGAAREQLEHARRRAKETAAAVEVAEKRLAEAKRRLSQA